MKTISVIASVYVWRERGWEFMSSPRNDGMSGYIPYLKPGGLLRPELGDGLRRRAAEIAATIMKRYADSRRSGSIDTPLARVLFPNSSASRANVDEHSHLNVYAKLFVKDVTDELPAPPQSGTRFIAILDEAWQSRAFPNKWEERRLTPRMTHHTVTARTIEAQVLRRFDEVVEKALIFSGWDPP